jgi:aspartyl-tRNA(Asn)/glutamyl-tRNA(Gln) amidotransferase subunit B
VQQYGLAEYDAGIIGSDAATSRYFETSATGSDAKLTANWIIGDISARLNSEDLDIKHCPVSAEQLKSMIVRLKDGTISSKIAKQVFDAMWAGEGDADTVIAKRGLKQVSDSGAIEKIVDEIVAANAGQVEQYRAADEAKRKKLLGFFVGQIMKASKGQANPGLVNDILTQRLGG